MVDLHLEVSYLALVRLDGLQNILHSHIFISQC